MQVAVSKSNKRCIAWETEKDEGPFSCPECKKEVVLKKGRIREHYYSHKQPGNCSYGAGESQIHYRCKKEIYQAFSSHHGCSAFEIEKPLNGVRPDVFAVIASVKVAIEVQKSTISIDDIERKSLRYRSLGIYPLWIIPNGSPGLIWHQGQKERVYRIKEWEKYLHAMYYGRLYYWKGGLSVSLYHFDKFRVWVESKEWFDNEDGEYREEGGYHRDTRSLKRPLEFSKRMLNIAEDFSPVTRQKFNSKKWSIPECNIWFDLTPSWW